MGFLHEDVAARLVNRSKWTLRDWRLAGHVTARRRNTSLGHWWEYDEHSLLGTSDRMDLNRLEQRRVAGSGRGNRCWPQTGEGLWDDGS